jgi:hypothetical protein
LTCTDVRELAPELALGVLDGVDRAEALNHTERCTACRGLVADYTHAADALPLAVAEAEPPDGFEQRVLREIGSGRRRNRRVIALVAVAAAAAAILSIVGVRLVEHDDSPSAPTAVAAEQVRQTLMEAEDGSPVGWAYVSDGRPATVAVSVAYELPTGEYQVILSRSGATSVPLGSVQIVDGHGSFTAVTEANTDGDATIALVDASGRVVCEGTLA